jgi:hypothetical protein
VPGQAVRMMGWARRCEEEERSRDGQGCCCCMWKDEVRWHHRPASVWREVGEAASLSELSHMEGQDAREAPSLPHVEGHRRG